MARAECDSRVRNSKASLGILCAQMRQDEIILLDRLGGNNEIETVWLDPIGSRAREWGCTPRKEGGVVVGWQKGKLDRVIRDRF
jgi:hypothetical protein